MLAVIGSRAIIEQGHKFREPLDYDIVGQYDEIIALYQKLQCFSIVPIAHGKKVVGRCKTGIYEAEIAWRNSTSEELLKLILSDPNTKIVDNLAYASLNVCFMLKMTHRFKKNNPHFLKTMSDIHTMRNMGATVLPEHKDFFKRRLKETLNYSHPNLNQSKKDFFSDIVPYKYDHDSIHQAIKLYDKPAYEFYKPDANEVYTSKALFYQQPLDIRLAGVYEESCVLALERSQIPYPETDRLISFKIALEKVCTSITSGWFREFAWEHYYEVMNLYNSQTELGKNYKDVFEHTLQNDTIIRPFRL